MYAGDICEIVAPLANNCHTFIISVTGKGFLLTLLYHIRAEVFPLTCCVELSIDGFYVWTI